MHLDPASLAPEDRYKLLIGLIVPRPIAWVSTIGPDALARPVSEESKLEKHPSRVPARSGAGPVNLAPFSFFNGVGSNPMTVLFCPVNKPDGTDKDTLRNCKLPSDVEVDPATGKPRPGAVGGTGEFVVNFVDEAHATRMAACAEPLPYGESEFELAGLDQAPSKLVRPPRVASASAAFECLTQQVIRTNPGHPGGGNIVIGRVVHVHVRDDLADEKFRTRFHTDPAKLRAIGRMGGLGYTRTNDRFEMPMGRAALERPSIE